MNTNLEKQSPGFIESQLGGQGAGLLFYLFRFFASLHLAVTIIFLLIVFFSVGTFIESKHGADTAKILVYDSPWLYAVLFFLVINLTASAVDRLPWKKKHIGFVITHLGIIMILIGSFVTKAFMIDAQMAITEGESEYQITLSEPMLYILDHDTSEEWTTPLKKHPFPWEGNERLTASSGKTLPLDLSLTHFYPKGRMTEELVAASSGPAAIFVTLESSFFKQEISLLENHSQLGNQQVGPARFIFTDELLEVTSPEEQPEGYLEIQLENSSRRIPISADMNLSQAFPVKGTGYQVRVESIYRNALIIENQLKENTEAGEEMKNPAVVFYLEGEGLKEKHTAFAKFPEFPTLHGMQPSATGADIFYRLSGDNSRGEAVELRFIRKEASTQTLLYQIVNGFQMTNGEVKVGDTIPLGWMDMKFHLSDYYPSAKLKRSFTPAPNTSESIETFPAIQIHVNNPKKPESLWLPLGLPEHIETAGKNYHVVYEQRKQPVGFRLFLKDFRVETYAGTNRPASFESDVILKDDFKGIEKETTVSMNEPLDYNGFRVFQASYIKEEGKPEISIFSVVQDPGIWIKYSGSIVMILGILIMFSSRKFNFKKGI